MVFFLEYDHLAFLQKYLKKAESLVENENKRQIQIQND